MRCAAAFCSGRPARSDEQGGEIGRRCADPRPGRCRRGIEEGQSPQGRGGISCAIANPRSSPLRPDRWLNSFADEDLTAVIPPGGTASCCPRRKAARRLRNWTAALPGRRQGYAHPSHRHQRRRLFSRSVPMAVSAPRLCGLTWGAEDLSAAAGPQRARGRGRYTPPMRDGARVGPFRGPCRRCRGDREIFPALHDEKVSRPSRARSPRGFTGMLAIHPSQILPSIRPLRLRKRKSNGPRGLSTPLPQIPTSACCRSGAECWMRHILSGSSYPGRRTRQCRTIALMKARCRICAKRAGMKPRRHRDPQSSDLRNRRMLADSSKVPSPARASRSGQSTEKPTPFRKQARNNTR